MIHGYRTPFGKLNPFAPVAQRIEQLPSKQWAGGSSPLGRATLQMSIRDTSVTDRS